MLFLFQVKEDTPSGTWTDVGTTDAYKTNIIVPNLDTEKKYRFQVAAENDVGRGEFLETDKTVSPPKAISECNINLFFFIIDISVKEKVLVSQFLVIVNSSTTCLIVFITSESPYNMSSVW